MTPPRTTQRPSAMTDQDVQATTNLLESLYSFGKNPGDDAKLLRHTDHTVAMPSTSTSTSTYDDGTSAKTTTAASDDPPPSLTITSWKMQDYAYKRDPCPYPTRARGLFTLGKHRMVARAYDKFFNVDEVTWTKWINLPDLTAPPYYLTLKSNGCLILIAALSPEELLVTSKHAIGQARDVNAVSHAEVGERWLDRHLKRVGKSRRQLAQRLWRENWTCVAELCDDSFEEHILPYADDISGLHLHGIVVNHPTLLTLSPPEVNAVAKEYGFIETAYTVLQSVAEVKAFAESVSKDDGRWNGQHVEGFVVRAALKSGSLDKQPHPNDLTEDNWSDPRRVFMWKIKFDQPYLMWREWREVTKRILSEKKRNGDDVAARGRQKLSQSRDKTMSDVSKGKQREGLDAPTSVDELADTLARTSAFSSLQQAPTRQGKAVIDEGEDEESIEEEEGEMKGTSGGKGKGKAMEDASTSLPSSIRADKIRNPETRLYAIWVEGHMQSHPEAFAHYQENRGIIAVREAFLRWRTETDEGRKMEEKILGSGSKSKSNARDSAASKEQQKAFTKTLIVPVAVPGCGKTLIGVALSHLFGFAHTQSDDIEAKKAAKHFEAAVAKLLQTNDVVYADKNNHLKQHRQAMAEIAQKSKEPVRLVAIVWPLTKLPQNEIHRICSDRIVGRGENHQSLRPLKTGEHEIILMRFFSQTEPFDLAFNTSSDSHFHEVIEMDVSWDFRRSLEYVIERLCDVGDVKGVNARPTSQEIDAAVEKALGYKPSLYKEMKVEGLDPKQKGKGPRYYGIAVEVDLPKLLEKIFHAPAAASSDSHAASGSLPSVDRLRFKVETQSGGGSLEAGRKFFDDLKTKDRIEKRPHVTLIHESELKPRKVDVDGNPPSSTGEASGGEAEKKEVELCKALWDKCKAAASRWGTETIEVTLTLGPLLVWDGRAMSIQVSHVEYGGVNVRTDDMPSDDRKDSYHITVGTLSQDIRPIEGRWLMESALKGERESKAGLPLTQVRMETVQVKGRIKGLF